MHKEKVENFIVISFIGLIIALFVGLGGNIDLRAGLPASTSKSEVNFEERLNQLDTDLESGTINKYEYDSIAEVLRMQIKRREALRTQQTDVDKMPEWVTELGITEPQGMKFDPDFSSTTSIKIPAEGFNSVSLVYTGLYETAVAEAAKIAKQANLVKGGVFLAKKSPKMRADENKSSWLRYMNYSLCNTNKDFLISVEVELSGRLTILATDNKQLKERLLAYEPLNSRQNSAEIRKK